MTEVTSYPNPHDFGASSRRLLAPAPTPRAHFFAPEILADMAFPPPSSQSYYGPSRPSLGARSSSVSSSSSSASYHAASSRTLSPALPAPASSAARAGANVAHRQHNLVHRPSYVSQTPPPFIFSSAPQYLPSQTVTHFPLYAPIPAPRSYPQVSGFGFQQPALPQPSAMSYQAFPSAYPPYPAYQAPSELISSYQHHPLAHLQDHYRPSIFGSPNLPLTVLQNIVSHLGYLDVIRLSWVNRWLNHHVDPNKVPEEEKIALMLRAEQEYKRYSLRTSAPSAPEVDHVGRDSGHLACYHCFKMKAPSEFELFRYNPLDERDDNETEASTPGQTPAPPPTSNPHYDPSITRSSLGKKTEKMTYDQSSPRIKETWGTRRFCIPCGVKKGFYKPGSLIELRSDKPGGKERKGKKGDKEGKEAKWICNCYKIHKKPETLVCDDCNGLTPMSQNRGPPMERGSPYASPFASSSYVPTTTS